MFHTRLLVVSVLSITAAANADLLVIEPTYDNATLEPIAVFIPGIEDMDPHDIAREAAILALSPEGWDLASYKDAHLASLGPPDQPGWEGGVEWMACCVPGESSG